LNTGAVQFSGGLAVSKNLTVGQSINQIYSTSVASPGNLFKTNGVPAPVGLVKTGLTGTVGTITGTGPWSAVLSTPNTTGVVVGSFIIASSNSGGTTVLYGGTPTTVVVTAINPGVSISYTSTGGTTPVNGTGTISTVTFSEKLVFDGWFYATKVFNAVYNDIADFIEVDEECDIEFGKVYCMDENGKYYKSKRFCDNGIIGIASDTYGFGVGSKGSKKEIPIAIGGFVLAYVDRKYPVGTPLTTGVDGFLQELIESYKLRFPERIVATYWKEEPLEEWNGIKVNGRHWVKIK